MKMKRIYNISIYFLLTSCGAGISDFKRNLGNGYFFISDGFKSNKISYSYKKYDSIIVFPIIDSFGYDKKFIIVKQKYNKDQMRIILVNELDNLARAFRFVDSLPQKKIQSIYREAVKSNKEKIDFYTHLNTIISPNNSENDQRVLIEVADSLLANDPKYKYCEYNNYNYFIINKCLHVTYGPYDRNKYSEKRKEIHVDENLLLNKY